MRMHNNEHSYGWLAKSLHWIIAFLIITVWVVGYYAIDMPNTETKHKLFDLHKSFGMLILMLVAIRLSWRLYDCSPGFTNMNPIIATAAKTVHILLYAFMFIQPLSGWAMSSAAGYNPTFFGLFKFPGLVAKNSADVGAYVAMHNGAAMIMLTLFILHVSGALFHHFVLKDNTLRRMTVD